VRPGDPDVLRTTRDILLQKRDSLAAGGLELFSKAKALFNAFAGKLVYVNDPKLSADYVQYPDETLRLRGGDCDDMTVCFASLLASIGIATAFVDVVPPGAPHDAHIYLIFDTGLDPRFASNIAQNSKRYVVRKNHEGRESVWIPVETTLTMKGFEEAWRAGANEYYDDVEVHLGMARRWVKLVDVE
jgi:transglutaminase-like putative cysteine protease